MTFPTWSKEVSDRNPATIFRQFLNDVADGKFDGPRFPPAGMSPEQAAHYSGLSRVTIDRLRKSGRLRSSKIGNRVVIRRESLDELLRAAESTPIAV